MRALLRPIKLRHPEKRVFCFSHAGGNASMFVPWAKSLAPSIEVVAVQLPGHGNRYGEPLATDIDELAVDLAHELEPLLGEPYVFFGHSMGSLVAFELIHLFLHEAVPLPRRLIVSAFVAPQHLPDVSRVDGVLIEELPEARLIAFLRSLGSEMAGPALDDPELRALALPIVRADFSVLSHYRPLEVPPIEVPITAVAAARDPLALPALMEGWREHTRDFTFVVRPGGHFLIEDDALFLLDLLRSV